MYIYIYIYVNNYIKFPVNATAYSGCPYGGPLMTKISTNDFLMISKRPFTPNKNLVIINVDALFGNHQCRHDNASHKYGSLSKFINQNKNRESYLFQIVVMVVDALIIYNFI